MKKAYAKWNIMASRDTIIDMIEDYGFYIQTYRSENDDNSNTIDCDTKNCRISESTIKGCWCVTLVGETENKILSPGHNEEVAPALDNNGRQTDEAFEFGFLK